MKCGLNIRSQEENSRFDDVSRLLSLGGGGAKKRGSRGAMGARGRRSKGS